MCRVVLRDPFRVYVTWARRVEGEDALDFWRKKGAGAGTDVTGAEVTGVRRTVSCDVFSRSITASVCVFSDDNEAASMQCGMVVAVDEGGFPL